ncbi:hypothetical protein C1H46_036728 [Malus baccata]|uniref:25S rRNA (uridine-N(3))-methyltransferase BMT5-like domain-containing protein n=1 Tax=Malus baccata TaxID=106549 RepID=A0A540KU39_MALBA|nr:hypothetical protein C1H46_036728 [Malus baccata]
MELFSLERRIKHNSSSQKILLVGEGDFSFPVCLARTFCSATSMVATSLDSEVTLMMDYSKATSNLNELKARGCSTLLGVKVNTVSQHPFLINQRFDCIFYTGYIHGSSSAERSGFQIMFIRSWLTREMLICMGRNSCDTRHRILSVRGKRFAKQLYRTASTTRSFEASPLMLGPVLFGRYLHIYLFDGMSREALRPL